MRDARKKKIRQRVRLRVLRQSIDGVPGAAITAWVGSDFVGSVILSHLNSRSASVTSLFVALGYRHCGIAFALLEECARIAAKHKCDCLGLIVQPKNPARYFYPKAGYRLAYEYSDKSLLFSRSLEQSKIEKGKSKMR